MRLYTNSLLTAGCAGAALLFFAAGNASSQTRNPAAQGSPPAGGAGNTAATPLNAGAAQNPADLAPNAADPHQQRANQLRQRQLQQNQIDQNTFNQRGINQNQLTPNQMRRPQLNGNAVNQNLRNMRRWRPQYNPRFTPEYNAYLNQYYLEYQRNQYRSNLMNPQNAPPLQRQQRAGEYERQFSRIGDDDFLDERDDSQVYGDNANQGFNNGRRTINDGTPRQQQAPGQYTREFSRIGDDDFLDERDNGRFSTSPTGRGYYDNGTGRFTGDGTQQRAGEYEREFSRIGDDDFFDSRDDTDVYNGQTGSPGLNVYAPDGSVRQPASSLGWR